MFILKFVRFILGYTTILVSGSYCERFLNISARRGLGFWDVKKLSPREILLCLPKKALKTAQEIADKADCTIKIERGHGALHILSFFKGRKALIFGAAVFPLMLFASTFFLWEIEYVGESGLDRALILSMLEEKGVKSGALIRSIDIDRVRNEILIESDELSWIGINIKGTKATVDARRRTEKPEILDTGEPCEIVAAKPGVILTIDTKAGTALVKPGDTVDKDKVLIKSEVVLGREKGTIYVHALGDVVARTWYERELTAPLFEEKKVLTGNTEVRRTLKIFGFEIKLYMGDGISYKKYDKITLENPLIGKKSAILALMEERYTEYVLEPVSLSEEQAAESAAMQADLALFKSLPDAVILSRELSYTREGNLLRMKIIYECKENIGVKRKLGAPNG